MTARPLDAPEIGHGAAEVPNQLRPAVELAVEPLPVITDFLATSVEFTLIREISLGTVVGSSKTAEPKTRNSVSMIRDSNSRSSSLNFDNGHRRSL
jgi:hypothetical protein